jgi:8-oxo-dGTP pyrophosphatase MutT (NUDIX family)
MRASVVTPTTGPATSSPPSRVTHRLRTAPMNPTSTRRGVTTKADSSQSRITGETELCSTRWLKLVQLRYDDPTGTSRVWDCARRPTTSSDAEADAVCVFAVLKRRGETRGGETLLVRQFRPATGGETIELPAGLIDDGETAETAALRELREECGYVGVVRSKTPPVVLSPGLSDERVVMVTVDVDLDDDANANPTQELEGSEFISVIRTPVDGLLSTLDALTEEGKQVFAGLYTMAWALENAKTLL